MIIFHYHILLEQVVKVAADPRGLPIHKTGYENGLPALPGITGFAKYERAGYEGD